MWTSHVLRRSIQEPTNLSHVKEKNSNPKKIAIENRVLAKYKIVDVW